MKYLLDGSIESLKARFVAKGYIQTYGVDYAETFSPVTKNVSIIILISLAANLGWSLFQLDVKNAFLNGDLKEELYMEKPPGFVAQGEFGKVCKLHKAIYDLKQSPRACFGKFRAAILMFGLRCCQSNCSVFCHTFERGKILLIVYVDDIIITGDDRKGIHDLKTFLQNSFQTKDLCKLRYFLGIELARSKEGIELSQRRYVLDILEETSLLGSKPVETPMDHNVKLYEDQGELLSNPKRYRH